MGEGHREGAAWEWDVGEQERGPEQAVRRSTDDGAACERATLHAKGGVAYLIYHYSSRMSRKNSTAEKASFGFVEVYPSAYELVVKTSKKGLEAGFTAGMFRPPFC